MSVFAHNRACGSGRVPLFFWWPLYFGCAIWGQEALGGLDLLTPSILVCLQFSRWWTGAWLTVACIFLHEGVGAFVFGTSPLFYAGMFLFFFAVKWLFDPRSPLFLLFFSLLLAIWLNSILFGSVTFQEFTVHFPDPWTRIGQQWMAYVLMWSISSVLYPRWVGNGRV